MMRVKKSSEFAVIPKTHTSGSAGYDLCSAYDYVISGRGKELIKTDLAFEIPQGYYGRVAPRSGLAWKNHIDIGAGVIDSDYRGDIGVIVFNHGENEFIVSRGDRIAQLIITKIINPELIEVNEFDDTDRGSGGFGSTGK